MSNLNKLEQPYLGMLGAVICIVVSLAICAQFDPQTFGTWVTLIMVAMVPTQIVLGLVWETKYPAFIGGLDQPWKGLGLLACMFLAGVIVAPASIFLLGGGVTPPLPYVVMYIIFSVIVTFWTVIVMQCWPVSAVIKSSGLMGLGVLLWAYAVTYVLFVLFFDFSFLKATPVYMEQLDPQGVFSAWVSLSFALTSLVVMLALVLLDFAPVAFVIKHLPKLGAQPLFGILSTLVVLVLTTLIWQFFINGLGIDSVVHMVRVAASMVFGQFIMLIMLQTAPVQAVAQPLKGLVLLAIAALLAILMYAFYSWMSGYLVGPLSSGAPEYQLELWLASAMLAITFPVLVFFAEFLNFWPLVPNSQETDDL